MVTAAKRRSNNRWDKEHMTYLGCKVRKERAQQAREAAAANCTTVSAVLLRAIDDLIEGGASARTLRVQFDPAEDGVRLHQIVAAAEASGESVDKWIMGLIRRELYGG